MELTVNLTERQVEFLKKFAANHYPGARDNLCTSNPIHVVQTTRYNYLGYDDEAIEWMGNEKEIIFVDMCNSEEYSDERELIASYGEYEEEEIKPFEELENKEFNDILILDYEDYFQAYGVSEISVYYKVPYYEPVAYFFILEEAKRYIDYQRHNLNKPRTYTYSGGYANMGDYNHFWELLFGMGEKLNSL